jgi:pimeloyl-ACP methyl ester carboxylesterase
MRSYPTDSVHEEPIDPFSAGRGDPQKLASAVLPAARNRTRVCTYDRPNTTLGADIESERHGEVSTPQPQPHSVEHDVTDLRALRNAAGESGPYVLVAHSYGGLIAELYARTHPADVVGRVNVDVTSAFLRDTLSREEFLALIESTRTPPEPGGEALEIGEAIDLIDAATPATQMPAIVLVADKPPDLSPGTLTRFARLLEAQNLLAADLRAKLLTRTNSGHHIHVEQPQIVSDATREIVEGGPGRVQCGALRGRSAYAWPPLITDSSSA